MPTRTIAGDKHVALRFSVPPLRRTVHVVVEAELPVETAIVTSAELERFRNGDDWEELVGPVREARNHNFEVKIPRGSGRFYLLIVNWTKENVAVHYEVRF